MTKKDLSAGEAEINKALNKIRPYLQSHGGDVRFVGFNKKKGVVKVKLIGGCSHCPMAQITLKQGIEKLLKQEFPEIKRVEPA